MSPKTLASLWQAIGQSLPPDAPNPPVSGVYLDSRQVQPGGIFVALTGGQVDAHRFVPDAIQRGAVAIVGTRPPIDLPVPYAQVQDARKALAQLSAALYDYPAHRLTVIGVTGTDGKTTTSNLLYHILHHAGIRVGMVSTVNARIGNQELDTGFHVTTPEAPDVQRYLSMMVQAGLTHAVLEATSHGLEQQRVGECAFDVAVVTNITHEHLDYHGDYRQYRAAKARLFGMLGQTPPKAHGTPRVAVLNRDDASYDYLWEVTPQRARRLSYGMHPKATFRAEEVEALPDGMRFTLRTPRTRERVTIPLLGAYNVSNVLAALTAAAGGLGVDLHTALDSLRTFPGIPGRMERIALGQDFIAIVDFAHTPNALTRALETVRALTTGRVIAVFGSAGLRDRQKRRLMAETSARMADLTVLTAEDPRTESLEDILAEMAAGALAQGGVEGETFWRIPDRREAIRFAVKQAQPGDVVIVCGKGHEQSMCFGETEYPWDDRTALRAALSEHLGLDGPAMPFLPT
ncbi:MAG: UDP-N-acetylmuramoyl-L-alanyl-D-glutamate--2,6-diaminopimelate ligase [Anaerolineae bacterium]|nr:MAG: UDP-N-acetylmuramoyl-L-alanyl-D-glutamate--2,6-diaminopimelate ligase [Anaerolineae bacterium]